MVELKAGARKLTEKQKKILRFIMEYIDEYSYPPSIREVGDHFGIRSTNGVFDHLNALARKNYIKREYFTSRSIVVLRDPDTGLPTDKSEMVNSKSVPYLGEAAAGSPIVPFDKPEEFLAFDVALIPKKTDKLFCLRVCGDSMTGDGIDDGDFVVVQKSSNLKKGQIGVVRLNQETAIKHIHEEGSTVTLKSSNKAYKPIKVTASDEFKVLGRVIGVYHHFE